MATKIILCGPDGTKPYRRPACCPNGENYDGLSSLGWTWNVRFINIFFIICFYIIKWVSRERLTFLFPIFFQGVQSADLFGIHRSHNISLLVFFFNCLSEQFVGKLGHRWVGIMEISEAVFSRRKWWSTSYDYLMLLFFLLVNFVHDFVWRKPWFTRRTIQGEGQYFVMLHNFWILMRIGVGLLNSIS